MDVTQCSLIVHSDFFISKTFFRTLNLTFQNFILVLQLLLPLVLNPLLLVINPLLLVLAPIKYTEQLLPSRQISYVQKFAFVRMSLNAPLLLLLASFMHKVDHYIILEVSHTTCAEHLVYTEGFITNFAKQFRSLGRKSQLFSNFSVLLL